MSLEAGHKLGPYEIIEQAGRGGMGEVYKARDTRLDRTVAIKILPDVIASMPDLRQRFDREAKAISSLNHANICTLFDVGHQDGTDFLVMEYLEGETLSERLAKGPIPYDELIHIAVQIAAGLDSAHRQGFVHRDLKPGNVMLTKEGAKLLDFGLAKFTVEGGVQEAVSGVTRTTPLTGQGTIIGTMQYMAPEQLEGKEADNRSDIFAFGAILYEMATGKRAFEGTSNASLIAAIIEREPVAISVVMPNMPPLFERLVKKCLSKDPEKRWQSASDLSDELRWISQAGSQVGLPAHLAARRRLKFTVARVIGVLAILTTIIFAFLFYREASKPTAEKPVARYTVNIKQGLKNIFWPRVSPDGKLIAFRADDSLGTRRIWVRPVNSLEAYPLLNTENADRFFWSPDSRYLAFFMNNTQLKKIPVAGGQSQLVCQTSFGSDGCWSVSDYIIFDGRPIDTIKIVPAQGGIAEPASLVDTAAGEISYAWPWFLPDGEHFLFTADIRGDSGSQSSNSLLKLGNINSTDSKTLCEINNYDRIEYCNEGYILYVDNDNLMGLPFDADKLEVTGQPMPIAMQIGTADNTYAFSVSNNGTLLYHTNNQSSLSEMVWVDRTGKRLETVGKKERYRDLKLSPDENKVAYSVNIGNDAWDVWIYDLKRNVPTRFTFAATADIFPIWSPDGEYIYYTSFAENSQPSIFRKAASGVGEPEFIYTEKDASGMSPDGFTPDGSKLLYTLAKTNADIGILDLKDSARSQMFANTSTLEFFSQISPDGKLVAYASAESGMPQIYIRQFDGSGGKWQVSTEGAFVSRWKGDGSELYYLTTEKQMMAVPINISGGLEIGNPIELFTVSMDFNLRSKPYDVSRDGQRFLMNYRSTASESGEIIVVQNWAEEFSKNKK